MGYQGVMDLPMKAFWLMSANIDRIMAQRDMRSLTVAVCGQSGDAAKEFRQRLEIEAGVIVKLEKASPVDCERDEVGFQELKNLL